MQSSHVDGQAYGAAVASWAGKMMGYTAYGKPSPQLVEEATRFFEKSNGMWHNLRSSDSVFFNSTLPAFTCRSVVNQRDLAASVQQAFNELISNLVKVFLAHVGHQNI